MFKRWMFGPVRNQAGGGGGGGGAPAGTAGVPAPAPPPAQPPPPTPGAQSSPTPPAPGAPPNPGALAGNDTPPTHPPAPAGTPPAGTPPGEPEEVITFRSSEQLRQRLERHADAHLKELFGTSDRQAIQAKLERAKKLEEEEQARADAAKSELEKAEEKRRAAEERAQAAERERDAAVFDAKMKGICATKGIVNIDYAIWAVTRAREKLPEGQEFDEAAYLDQLLGDDRWRAALGAPQPTNAPATTTPPGSPPTPPPAGGGGGEPKNAMDMSPEDFRRHRESLGGSGF